MTRYLETFAKHPLSKSALICLPPIGGTLRSGFNPRNIQYIPACPVECEAYSSGVVNPAISGIDLE